MCTGQVPNTTLMKSVIPESIVPDGPAKGSIRVARSMQVGIPRSQDPNSQPASSSTPSADSAEQDEEADDDEPLEVPYPHLFAIGDAADAFGAVNAGHTAYFQVSLLMLSLHKATQN